MRIFQPPCRYSDWTISIWHINPKWHAAAFHTKPCSSLLKNSRGDLPLCQEVCSRTGVGGIWRTLWQRACPSSTIDIAFNHPTIFPRGPYWGLSLQCLQLVRIHFPCQESGRGGRGLNGTSPRYCSFGQHSCCWHTVWGTDMGVGWHRSPFYFST